MVPGCQTLFDELESVIFEKFLPTIFGCEVSSLERELFSLPARMGGLGVFKPNEMSEMLYNSSKESTKVIVNAIRGEQEFEVHTHISRLLEVKADIQNKKKILFNEKLKSIMAVLAQLFKGRSQEPMRDISLPGSLYYHYRRVTLISQHENLETHWR